MRIRNICRQASSLCHARSNSGALFSILPVLHIGVKLSYDRQYSRVLLTNFGFLKVSTWTHRVLLIEHSWLENSP
jgi:hypothetical protein